MDGMIVFARIPAAVLTADVGAIESVPSVLLRLGMQVAD